jgi:hypothetical protein
MTETLKACPLTDAQVKHLVDRFLSWRLPEDFAPDEGVKFDPDGAIKLDPRNHRYEPRGTNLFNADQAKAMVLHMLAEMPDRPQPTEKPLTREEVARIVEEHSHLTGYPLKTADAILARLPTLDVAVVERVEEYAEWLSVHDRTNRLPTDLRALLNAFKGVGR